MLVRTQSGHIIESGVAILSKLCRDIFDKNWNTIFVLSLEQYNRLDHVKPVDRRILRAALALPYKTLGRLTLTASHYEDTQGLIVV